MVCICRRVHQDYDGSRREAADQVQPNTEVDDDRRLQRGRDVPLRHHQKGDRLDEDHHHSARHAAVSRMWFSKSSSLSKDLSSSADVLASTSFSYGGAIDGYCWTILGNKVADIEI